MAVQLGADRFASIRDAARLLVDRAGSQEDHLQALAAAADTEVRHAEATLSQAIRRADSSLGELRGLLDALRQRQVEGAETARRLCAGAREQHVAARQLLTHLDGEGLDHGPQRDAVLVVDDYAVVREIVARVLRDAGFVVRTAANGLEGLFAAYEMRPAVIVMDVGMPVLDGIEATRLIKATDATRDARVIAYTGNPHLDDSRLETLFVTVLRKPAPPDVVVATVRQVASQVPWAPGPA